MTVDQPDDRAVNDDVEDFAPSGTDLVVSDPTDETAVMVTLDKHDEAVIVQELQGRLSKAMLYDFPQGGQRLVDLSWPGVRECIHEMNRTGKCRISIVKGSAEFESVQEDVGDGDEPCWMVTVMAEDEVTGETNYGTALEPKRIKLKDSTAKRRRSEGKFVDDAGKIADPFSRQKALGKAQRNAYKTFIPETLRQTLIAQYRGDAEALKVINAGAGAEQLAELPPPLTDDEAVELTERARAVYLEVREKHGPLKVLPARFDQFVRHAAHSHDRLRDLIAHLEQIRDEEKAE
jgi:hypothetical protein